MSASARLYPAYPQERYLVTSSTQTAMTLTAGRKAVTATSNQLYLGTSSVHRIFPLNGARGAVLQFIGDANNATITAAKVWLATFASVAGLSSPIDALNAPSFCDLNYFGTTGVVTLGNTSGVSASDIVTSSEFIADTIASWVTAAIGTTSESSYALGTSDRYSPTGDVPASLVIPNFGPYVHGFVIEFDVGTAVSANALITLTP